MFENNVDMEGKQDCQLSHFLKITFSMIHAKQFVLLDSLLSVQVMIYNLKIFCQEKIKNQKNQIRAPVENSAGDVMCEKNSRNMEDIGQTSTQNSRDLFTHLLICLIPPFF